MDNKIESNKRIMSRLKDYRELGLIFLNDRRFEGIKPLEKRVFLALATPHAESNEWT